jgi:hypothetical protein
MAKKLMNFVVLAMQGVKVNWSTIIFNNPSTIGCEIYLRQQKFNTSKENIEFRVAQVVDILL